MTPRVSKAIGMLALLALIWMLIFAIILSPPEAAYWFGVSAIAVMLLISVKYR